MIVDKYFYSKNASDNKFDTSRKPKFLHIVYYFSTQHFPYLFINRNTDLNVY